MISMNISNNSNNYLIAFHYTTINCYCLIVTILDSPTVKETPCIELENIFLAQLSKII